MGPLPTPPRFLSLHPSHPFASPHLHRPISIPPSPSPHLHSSMRAPPYSSCYIFLRRPLCISSHSSLHMCEIPRCPNLGPGLCWAHQLLAPWSGTLQPLKQANAVKASKTLNKVMAPHHLNAPLLEKSPLVPCNNFPKVLGHLLPPTTEREPRLKNVMPLTTPKPNSLKSLLK